MTVDKCFYRKHTCNYLLRKVVIVEGQSNATTIDRKSQVKFLSSTISSSMQQVTAVTLKRNNFYKYTHINVHLVHFSWHFRYLPAIFFRSGTTRNTIRILLLLLLTI